ncbi:unnamed protein product [Prunus armeniaca]
MGEKEGEMRRGRGRRVEGRRGSGHLPYLASLRLVVSKKKWDQGATRVFTKVETHSSITF